MAQDPCMDDPEQLLKSRVCLEELSKTVVEGSLALRTLRKPEQCTSPAHKEPCQTLKALQRLRVAQLAPFQCDSSLAKLLDGQITADPFVTLYKQDGTNRGVHSGDFTWKGTGFVITGRMAGVTKIGTHRPPATLPQLKGCEEPCNAAFLQGRLYGTVTKVTGKQAVLRDCRIIAVYRFGYVPSPGAANSPLSGVIEGVVILPCLK